MEHLKKRKNERKIETLTEEVDAQRHQQAIATEQPESPETELVGTEKQPNILSHSAPYHLSQHTLHRHRQQQQQRQQKQHLQQTAARNHGIWC